MLVPTTILVSSTRRRSASAKGYPIWIEAPRASRPPRARSACSRAAAGTVDVGIGTHRLLQKNVLFRDLACSWIDERNRLRRRAQGAHQAAQEDGRRAHAHRHADPAHAPARVRGAARPLGDRHAARRPARDPHPGGALFGGGDPRGDPARDAARRAGVPRAQPRADDRRDGADALAHGARGEGDRRARAAPRARPRKADSRIHARPGRRVPVHDDHRERRRQPAREHDHREPRRCARPRPALPAARARRPEHPARLRLSDGERTGQAHARRARRLEATQTSRLGAASAREPRSRDPRRGNLLGPEPGNVAEVGYDTYMEMLARRHWMRGLAHEGRSTRRSGCRFRRACPRSTCRR